MRKVWIVPFQLPWNWSADYQRQTVLELARRGETVVVYKHTLMPHFHLENVQFYTPRSFVPFKRWVFFSRLNDFFNVLWVKKKYPGQQTWWIFDPYFFSVACSAKLLCEQVLYDCVDYHSDASPTLEKSLRRWEKKLIEITDYFFVNSRTLQKIHTHKNAQPILVPQGFDSQTFQKSLSKKRPPFPINRPVIGFVGAINYRLNYLLLIELARSNPRWIFVFWGPIQSESARQINNLHSLQTQLFSLSNVIRGESSRDEVPTVIQGFDVCLIPYNTQFAFNRYSYPMKFFEYLYLHKPIISADIEELKRFPEYVYIAHTVLEWERAIRTILRAKSSRVLQKRQRALAMKNSWQHKVDSIFAALRDPNRKMKR